MEWVDVCIQLISNVGFPIFVSIALMKQNRENSEKHEKEVDKLNETIAANTLAINTLCERIK